MEQEGDTLDCEPVPMRTVTKLKVFYIYLLTLDSNILYNNYKYGNSQERLPIGNFEGKSKQYAMYIRDNSHFSKEEF